MKKGTIVIVHENSAIYFALIFSACWVTISSDYYADITLYFGIFVKQMEGRISCEGATMEEICDLHIHSAFSDGTLTPAQLIRLAQQLHVSAVALCDHNTVAGLPEFLEAAEGSGVRAVPGIEFSTDYAGTELHILALAAALCSNYGKGRADAAPQGAEQSGSDCRIENCRDPH